jgi:MinD-like ATPase involved in chromosome partitioning or flagellar assembly
MKDLDFDLHVRRESGGAFLETVRSPAGEAEQRIELPMAELERLLDEFAQSLTFVGEAMREPVAARDVARALGGLLFRSFFAGETRSRYDMSREQAKATNAALRVRVRTTDQALNGLPWELLYDERSGQHLSLSSATPLIRYVDLSEPVGPMAAPRPIRILGVIAAPPDQPALNARHERQRIENALSKLVARKDVEIEWLATDTWRALQQKLREGPWHVLHFIGHGTMPDDREGALALTTEDGRRTQWLRASVFADLLLQKQFSLVVLNSCDGSRTTNAGAFTSSASALVKRGVPAVVAMQRRISDRSAIEFARTFYEAAADGYSIEAAVTEARVAMQVSSEQRHAEWSTPTLFLRAQNGRLFPQPSAGGSGGGTPLDPNPPVAPRARVPVLSVMGTKGGVGKGMVVSCFAQLLAEAGRRICIIDFDLESYGMTRDAIRRVRSDTRAVRTVFDQFAPHAVGFEHHPGGKDERLWDVTPDYLTKRGLGKIWLLPATNTNVEGTFDVVANIKPPREETLLQVTAELIARARKQVPDADAIVVDCGAGKNPVFSAAFASADYGYIVTPPDVTCVEEVFKIKLEHLRRYPDSKANVFTIVNRVTSQADRERTRSADPIGYIPRDPLLEQDNFRAPVDYDIGYDDVFNAVHGCLRSSLGRRDQHLVPDEIDIRIRPWLNRLIESGAAARTERSWKFRFPGLAFGTSAALAAAWFAGLVVTSIASRHVSVGRAVGMFALFSLASVAVGGFRSFRRRRRILRDMVGLAGRSGVDRNLRLDQVFGALGHEDLRWLNGISNEQQAQQRSQRTLAGPPEIEEAAREPTWDRRAL